MIILPIMAEDDPDGDDCLSSSIQSHATPGCIPEGPYTLLLWN